MALNSDGKQAYSWIGKDLGEKVGTIATDINGKEIRDYELRLVLMRHAHSGGLEWVLRCVLTKYPEQPIEEPSERKAGA